MGALASFVERRVRGISDGRMGGLLGWVLVTSSSVSVALVIHLLACGIHEVVGLGVDALLVYFTIAPRDLAQHARRVQRALEGSDLTGARTAVAAIVGRDTEVLDVAGVARAAVEAVAESTVDGITAPLFWSAVLGPLGGIGYRAVNTLDSMWGHHDERYEQFGFFAARLDDAANYLPARLSVVWICGAALLARLRVVEAWRAAWKHGRRHASPNSGLSEAAYAGALGVMLGGRNRYDGEWHEGPSFGFDQQQARPGTIGQSIQLMWLTTLVATLSLVACLLLLSRGLA